jgi:hypothetical protein
MAHAMINDLDCPHLYQELDQGSPRWHHFINWSQDIYNDVQGHIGYVPACVLHLWHGNLINRRYQSRHSILTQHQFDPNQDISLAPNGLWQWNSPKSSLHEAVITYFQQRQEDGTS